MGNDLTPASYIRAIREVAAERCWNCREWPEGHAPDGGCSGMPTMYEAQGEDHNLSLWQQLREVLHELRPEAIAARLDAWVERQQR